MLRNANAKLHVSLVVADMVVCKGTDGVAVVSDHANVICKTISLGEEHG